VALLFNDNFRAWRNRELTPSILADPEVGTKIPMSMRILVVLLAPFGPSSAKICPLGGDSLRSTTAGRP
jgi:hypothetical protein